MFQDPFEDLIPGRRPRIRGPEREPAPLYPEQRALNQEQVRTERLRQRNIQSEIDRREQVASGQAPLTAVQRERLQGRYNSLTGFERQLGEVERLYREGFQGERGSVLGMGGDRNVAGYLPNLARPINQTFDQASQQIIDQIAEVYGITGGELNSMAELRARLGPYLPASTDNDRTIDMKLRSLRGILGEQRQSLSRALGLEESQGTGAVAPVATIGGEGRPIAPSAGSPSPNGSRGGIENIYFGSEAEQQAQADADTRARGEVLIGYRTNPDGSRTPLYGPPAGRGGTLSTLRDNAMENIQMSNTPLGAGLALGGTALFGVEGANALLRGAIDVPTMGLSDEIRAGFRGVGGEDFNASLENERGIARYDENNNFGARLFGQAITGAGLPFNPAASIGRQAATGAGYGAAYGFGSGEGANRLPGAAIGATIGAGAGALGGAINRGANNRRELLDAAERQNIDITRLEAGGIGTRMAGGVIGRTFGNVPMVQGSRASAASAEAARDRIAANIGTVLDTAGAGQAAQRGMRRFLDNSRNRANQLEDRINIPANREASRTATIGALQELTSGFESNPRLRELLSDNRLEAYLGALQGTTRDVPTGILDQAGRPITRGVQDGGTLSWQDLRAFRSRIGEIIEQPSVAGDDTSKAALRRLYGALSTDMEATATSEGGRALTAFRRYNQYYRGRESRRETIVSDILGPDFRGGAEQAFDRINRWSQQTGGNFANVARALRSMPADDANAVRATIFGRMGQESSGRLDEAAGQTFNASTFATQWNNLSMRAKNFLVPDGQHRRDLNDLARVTTAMRQSNQYQNVSNTTLGTNAALFATGLFASPIKTVGLAALSLVGGKLLGSRAGAGWLARATRMRTPAAQRSHIGRLRAVALRDPAIAQEALGLQRTLTQAMNDNLPMRAAASDPARRDDRDRH